jgi:hypothetical protein
MKKKATLIIILLAVSSLSFYQKYEYKSQPWPSNATQRLALLQQMGSDGWRLAQVVSSTAYFEREVPTAPAPSPSPPPPTPIPTGLVVSPTGSDTASGSATAPFKTIARGLAALRSGLDRTLVIRGGTYAEYLSGFPSGTSWSDIVTVAAHPGEQAIVRPGSGNRVVDFDQPTQAYIVLDGLILDGTGTNAGVVKITNGANHIRLKNCEIRNSPQSHGVLITNGNDVSSHNELINCRIHNNGNAWVEGTRGAPHNIYISTTNNLVDGCEVYNCDNGYGAHLYDGEPESNIIRNSTFHHNNSGVLLAGADNLVVNTVFYDNLGKHLQVSDDNNRVLNNTFYGALAAIYVGEADGGVPVSNTRIQNNIAWAAADTIDSQFAIHSDSASATVMDNLTRQPIANRGTATVLLNNRTGDPLFVGLTDFRLRDGSSAIDSGAALAEVPTDKLGVARPQGRGYDLGAYER